MQLRGPIDVLEAAYSLEGSEDDWAARVGQSLYARLGRGLGLIRYSYRIDGGQLDVGSETHVDTHPDAPCASDELRTAPVNYLRETFASVPCATGLTAGGKEARAFVRARMRVLHARMGWRDVFVINAYDPTGEGLYFGLPSPRELRLSPAVRQTWGRVAVHIAAARRLRKRLDPAEAVMRPDGRVQHAIEDATSRAARSELATAVRNIERARGALRRSDPDRAVGDWKGLCAARWSIVEEIESDGKRYLLARRNDAPVRAGAQALTPREAQALAFASAGHSNKLIAYEMGITAATVGVLLHRAARRLGAKTRAQMIAAYEASRDPIKAGS